MAELPENHASEDSPHSGYSAPAPPPFQPVAPPFQPVGTPYQATGAAPQPIAAPANAGGGGAVKVVLIIVAVVVALGLIVASVVGYGVWRVSRAMHTYGTNGGLTINTPNGPITSSPAQKFTAEELGTDVYPGAQPTKGGVRLTLPTGPMVAANFVTSDSKQQVIAFYKDKLGSRATTMETGDGAILSVHKGKQDSLMLTITQKASQFGGRTQIHIMHTINNAS